MDELLDELPRALPELLDADQFARLSPEQTSVLRALSESTKAHVIAHRLRVPHGLPLWDVAGPAYYLEHDHLEALKVAERGFGADVALVAYARPLELRLPARVLIAAAQAYRAGRSDPTPNVG